MLAPTGMAEEARRAFPVPAFHVVDVAASATVRIAQATVDGPASGSLSGEGTIDIAGHPACAIRNPGGGRIVCAGISRREEAE